MNDGTVLSIRALKHTLGTFELSVPTLDLARGQVIGLVGPNGAGKTTLLDLVVGLTGATRGEIRTLGLDPVRDAAALRLRLGYMCDDLPLYDLPVRDLLALLAGYHSTWDHALVAELVKRFGLEVSQRPGELSKGQGSRLRTLLAVAHRPSLVVLDEPATGLDLSGRRALLTTLLEVTADPARTVVVSSHQLADLERIADTLVVLVGGQVRMQGPIDSIVPDGRTLEEMLLESGAA